MLYCLQYNPRASGQLRGKGVQRTKDVRGSSEGKRSLLLAQNREIASKIRDKHMTIRHCVILGRRNIQCLSGEIANTV